jgi:hypothetical protein
MNTSSIFLTEEEFEELFGKEVSRIIRVLGETAKNKCLACRGKCCREIGCGFYSEKFNSCPIYEIRPRECRYHFCHEILSEAPLSDEDKEILEKPLEDLLGDEKERISKLFPLFPQFALDSEGLTSLGIKEEVNSIIRAFEDGEMDENQAGNLLKSLCRKAVNQFRKSI